MSRFQSVVIELRRIAFDLVLVQAVELTADAIGANALALHVTIELARIAFQRCRTEKGDDAEQGEFY